MKMKITISGTVATGKSTIANIIRRALAGYGIESTHMRVLGEKVCLDVEQDISTEQLQPRMTSLKDKGLVVEIEEIQLNRNA